MQNAEELLSALPQNALESGSTLEWHVTCSIGAALFPRDAADFASLYEKPTPRSIRQNFKAKIAARSTTRPRPEAILLENGAAKA